MPVWVQKEIEVSQARPLSGYWRNERGTAPASLRTGLTRAGPHLEARRSVWVSGMKQASGILIKECLLVYLHGRLTAHSSPLPARDFQEQCLQANVAQPGHEPTPSLPPSLPPHISHVDMTHAGSRSFCQEQPEDCSDKVGWVTSGARNSPERLWNSVGPHFFLPLRFLRYPTTQTHRGRGLRSPYSGVRSPEPPSRFSLSSNSMQDSQGPLWEGAWLFTGLLHK